MGRKEIKRILKQQVSALLKETAFVVFDTETTGLPLTARIIEIGAVRVSKGRMREEFSSLVNPGRSIPYTATEIHGITDEMVATAPSLSFVLKGFLNFIGDDILVAHNAVFDLRMLALHFERERLSLFSNPTIDTHTLARKMLPQLGKYNLPFLIKYWQSPYNGCHRALVDAKHTAFIFLKMLRHNFTKSDSLDVFWPWVGSPLYAKNYLPTPGKKDLSNPKVRIISHVIERSETLEFIYANGQPAFKHRLVHPLICFRCGKHHYMEAFCYSDQVVKTFRLDRILKIFWKNNSSVSKGLQTQKVFVFNR